MANRRAGTIFFKANGVQYDCAGEFTYNIGANKREAIVGPEAVHGYKEMAQVAHIEGEIFDASNLDLRSFMDLVDATITLQLANGKTFVLHEAWNASQGDVTTGEGKIKVKFEGKRGEEV